MARTTETPNWVQYADAAIASFLGKPAWRSRDIGKHAAVLMKAAGESLPRITGQSAFGSGLFPTTFDAFRLGVRLWANLPLRCSVCTSSGRCEECVRFIDTDGSRLPIRTGEDGNDYYLHTRVCATMHDACPRSGVYCSLIEREALQKSVPGAHDCSMAFTPDNRSVRAFVRFGENPDPRSSKYRMWEFSRSVLLDATLYGLAGAGSYAIIPDPIQESGNTTLSDQLQSDPAMLLAFAFACRSGGDGLIPTIEPETNLWRPVPASARRDS